MTASPVVLLLVKVTLTLALGFGIVLLARQRRAALRHVVLAAAFAVVIALPVATTVAPPIAIAVPAPVATGEPITLADAPQPRDGMFEKEPPVTAAAALAPRRGLSISSLFVATWAIGAVVFLTPLLVCLWQARSLRRSGAASTDAQSLVNAIARESGIRRSIQVLEHSSASGPLTFSVWRPVILLPIDASTWSKADLRRALIHELEHVRRRDWMTQCLARAVCAMYWFHPLVWIAWRRLVVEAERACDDAVLASTALSARPDAATAYADQLVDLAKRLSAAARQPVLAMANRAALSTRIVAVLNDRQPRGRAGSRWIAVAAVAAVAIVMVLSPLRLVAALQSSPQKAGAAAAKLRYDVATIKACEPEDPPTSGARGTAGGTNASISPGRFTVPCVTTEQLIYLAYASYGATEQERLVNDDFGTASSPQKVRGGPDWVHSYKDKYTIEATAAGATDRTVLMGAMLQTLLEERFTLKLHRETEDVPMYELRVAKTGLKITPMKEGDCDPGTSPPANPDTAKPRCGTLNMQSTGGRHRLVFGGSALASIAAQLSRRLGVHVIDRTSVTDKFVMKLEFQLEGGSGVFDANGREVAIPPAPSLSAALEGLGLQLEKITGPRGYLVIDRIERPTPDATLARPPMRAAGAGPR